MKGEDLMKAEKKRNTTRARISAKTLRMISLRARLETVFLNDWLDHLSYLGWSGFPIGDNFGLIKSDVLEGWPRIGAFGIRKDIASLQRGDQSLIDELAERFTPNTELEDDE
jgi:hypothetical protein